MEHAPRFKHFIQSERLGINLQSNAVNRRISKQCKYKTNVTERVDNLRQVTYVRSPARNSIADDVPSDQPFPLKAGEYLVYNATKCIKESASVVNSAKFPNDIAHLGFNCT